MELALLMILFVSRVCDDGMLHGLGVQLLEHIWTWILVAEWIGGTHIGIILQFEFKGSIFIASIFGKG